MEFFFAFFSRILQAKYIRKGMNCMSSNDIFTFDGRMSGGPQVFEAERLQQASIIRICSRTKLELQLNSFRDTRAKTLAVDIPELFTYQELKVLSESKLLSGIERITVMKRSQNFYKAIDGILYSADGAELCLCPAAKQEAEISALHSQHWAVCFCRVSQNYQSPYPGFSAVSCQLCVFRHAGAGACDDGLWAGADWIPEPEFCFCPL